MGQDVDRTLFSRRDRQTYRNKVQRCLDALTLMLREYTFARDEPMTGVEVELNLVDGDLVPALRGRQVLDAINGTEFQSELGRWNLELNLPPRPLPGDEWRQFEHQLTDHLGLARSAAGHVRGPAGRHRDPADDRAATPRRRRPVHRGPLRRAERADDERAR